MRQHDDESLLRKLLHGVGSGLRNGNVLMSVSSDGGQTWSKGLASSDHAGGSGSGSLVQPNGTVIVPFQGGGIDVFSSTNGGASWATSQVIASIDSHLDAA